MKIVDIIWEKVHIDTLEHLIVAFSELHYAEVVLVKVTTDLGIVGYGEAAPFAPVTGETMDSVISALTLFRQGLIGKNPFNIEQIHLMMDQLLYGNSSAKCAVDLAMYDIMGKASGQPVYMLLGGYRNTVQSDITIGINDPEYMAQTAVRFTRELGFRILKVKAGIDPDDDIRALRLIREAVGPDIRLRVDANQGYDVSDALYAIEGFKKVGVDAVEQCLPYWNIAGMTELRSKVTGMKLMIDESLRGPKDAVSLVRAGCADILNIKLMKCGGLYEALKITNIAESNGVTCMVGCMLETKLAITAALSMVAARKNITEADCDATLAYKDESTGMSGGYERENDMFRLSDAPGFGIDLNF